MTYEQKNKAAISAWEKVTEPFNERKAAYAFFAARENNKTVQRVRMEAIKRNAK